MDIRITKTQQPKPKYTDESKLGFGQLFTDHMLTIRYSRDQGWHDAQIVPYGPLPLDPAAMVLHYGQEIFEGLKAYRTGDAVTLFRARDNFHRMNRSAERMCMAQLDVEQTYQGLIELLQLERDWVPGSPGTSLYIRPTMIATDPYLGVRASQSYLFYIILSPVGAYYAEGFKPVSIYVEDEYVRAVKGGTGFTKCGGNYAASILAGELAKKKGYSQVLWLDGVHRRNIEEVGAMNMFFVIDGTLVTPALQGSILPGITRDSILTLARDMGYPVQERSISIDEIYTAYTAGELQEAFGTGTAAVVSPVGELKWGERTMTLGNGQAGPVAQRLYDTLTGIQTGNLPDPYGWVTSID